MSQRPATSASPRLRLSPRGYLRRCILAGLSASSLMAVPAGAAQFGSPGWFAQQGAAAGVPGGAAPAPMTGPGLPPAITTPGQALQHASRSIANLNRAAEAIVAAQTAQSAARQLAMQAASVVPDGLAPGGLQVAAGAAADAANPQGCAPTNSCAWQNAALPVETRAEGKTTVTVTQTAEKAILTWDSFNVGKQTTLQFDQSAGRQSDGSNDWIALNRVSPGSSPSEILGTIKAEGSIYLINQNGIIFGGSSTVNVHSLIASTLPLYMKPGSSSLTPADDENYLRYSNQLFLDTGISSIGPGTASGNILGIGSGQIVKLSQLGELPGDIEIRAGSSISTGALGYSLIAAPNVLNAGTISATEGQVMLAAGLGVSLRNPAAGSLLLQPVISGRINDDANANADATPRSRVSNTGLIESRRGNIRLMGLDVDQDGVLASTTSVTRAGSIDILAQDEQGTDSVLSRTGSLRLGPASVTALLPDGNGETTLSSPAADQIFQPGSIRLTGGAVTLENGALLEAPGQSVRITALADSPTSRAVLPEGFRAGRVYIDAGAVIDVSGIANYELPMAANLVTVPRLGQNELADTPVQRGGVLFGIPVTVDARVTGTRSDGVAWVGTPLANVGGYAQQVPRKIQQMLQNGGAIALAGDEVITRSGSELNLDGGYVHYLGGVLETTRLIAANGAIVDIGSADPNAAYIGVAGRFVSEQPRWNTDTTWINPLVGGQGGVYEPAYVQGGNAGSLSVYGERALQLDGDVSAEAIAGRRQVSAGRMPTGGKFYAGAGNGLRAQVYPDLSVLVSGPSYVLREGIDAIETTLPGFSAGSTLPLPYAPGPGRWIGLATADLGEWGFATVTVVADETSQANQGGEILVEEGARVAVMPGGAISLTGSRVTVLADLSAPAGSISITATGATGILGSSTRPLPTTAQPLPGDIRVGAGVELDARGLWVNDGGRGPEDISGGAFINGGSIVLRTLQRGLSSSLTGAACTSGVACVADTTGSILLDATSLLDVSSGGRVLPSGQLLRKDGIVQGRGGSVSLLTYDVGEGQFGSSETQPLPTEQPTGGRLLLDGAIRGYGFSGGGTFSVRALGILIGDADESTPDWSFAIDPDWFEGQGFGAYVLRAEYDATITEGTVIRPVQSNLAPVYANLLAAPTGSDLYATDAANPEGIFTRVERLDDYHRQATDFSLFAGDYLNWRAGAGVLPYYDEQGVTGTLSMLPGARLLADPRARVVFGSNNQLTVHGQIVAHGGSITLTGDTGGAGYAQNPGIIVNGGAYSSDSKSVWLGASSLLDVSGIVLLDPLRAPVFSDGVLAVPRSGQVLDGGSVTLSNDTGYVIALSCRDAGSCGDPSAPGARIDVSGVSGVLDLPDGRTRDGLKPATVWSDAGSIYLGAGAGLFYRGVISAHGGAPEARGGSLSVTPLVPRIGPIGGFEGATRFVLTNRPDGLPEGALEPGESLFGPAPGNIGFGVDVLEESGVDTLQLGVNPLFSDSVMPVAVTLGEDLVISVAREITINAEALIGTSSDGDSTVRLEAPHVAIHGYVPGGVYPQAPRLPTSQDGLQLRVSADLIDLGGQFALRNFGKAEFLASGDIRLLTPSSYGYYRSSTDLTSATAVPGLLLSAGDLVFSAAQIYPATGNRFVIDVVSPDASVTFLGNANSANARTPVSAGGSLLVVAPEIVQEGVLRAPGGEIVLGVADPQDAATKALFSFTGTLRNGEPGIIPLPLLVTNSLRLAAGSVTSVSLDGLTVPYGQTVDGQNWRYNGSATSDAGAATNVPDLLAPPRKSITLGAGAVDLEDGATIDLAGGGDLQASEWVAGTGGSRDVLSQYNTVYSGGVPVQVPLYADARPVYAIIPGYTGSPAPYDPALVGGDPLVGQAVYLSGAPGLPAGVYTLLPAKYATLPGAYRVVQDTAAIDALPSQNLQLPDGSFMVAGRFTDTLTGSTDARNTAFLVQSGEVWQKYSQYSFSSANTFFPELADATGTAVARLPVDAGQLVIAATRTLGLGADLRTAAGQGGAGALVDIASGRIQIVDANSTALAGHVQVRAADLVALEASSLLIGGTRSREAAGDRITALASSVVLSNDDETLEAPEVLLVARADSAGDGVVLDAGSRIEAKGSIDATQALDIVIGQLPVTASFGVPGVAGVSGDGALLRVSNGAPVSVRRFNVPGVDAEGTAFGVLRIGEGASIKGDAAITLDSAASTLVAPGATFSAKAIDANSNRISFVADGYTGAVPRGLVIDSRTLAQFASADAIDLRSRGEIAFLGDLDIDLDAGLRLSANRFSGDGSDVAIAATFLGIDNALGAPSLAARAGTGALSLSAERIDIGAGATALSGFDRVTFSAEGLLAFRGAGELDAGAADVSVHAAQVLAEQGAEGALRTRGELRLDAQGSTAPQTDTADGGGLLLQGGALSIDTRVRGASLELVSSSGDLRLEDGARVEARGVGTPFFDVVRYADAGEIRLRSAADVLLDAGSVLDVSAAAGGGDAGRIDISANAGGLLLGGALSGGASEGRIGGSFSLDTRDATDLDALVAKLSGGGLDHEVSVRTRRGNLALSAGTTLRADSIRLVADAAGSGGQVLVQGVLDASGLRGGSIALFGRRGVDIQGSLLATGSDPDQRGGNVSIGTTGTASGATDAEHGYQQVQAAGSGFIDIGAQARIDVSGGTSGGLSGGTVHLRAPLLADGDLRVDIDPLATITGAREIGIEAYARWSTGDDTTGALHFDGIIDPAGRFGADGLAADNAAHRDFYAGTLAGFVRDPGFGFAARFEAREGVILRPGIELLNTDQSRLGGDIRVLSDWNLGAGRRGEDGLLELDYRYAGSIAPVLTLRAAGDLRLDASLSDGFFQNRNPFTAGGAVDNSASPLATLANPLPLLSANLAASLSGTAEARLLLGVDSSSYRLVAGADDSSADPLALLSGADGSVLLDKHQSANFRRRNGSVAEVVAPTMVRTGTGSIAIAAAGDVAMLDAVAPGVIYTAGRPVAGATLLPVSTVLEGSGGLPVVIDTGLVNPEAAGDLRIRALRDIVGIQQVTDEGARTGKKGTNLSQYWWPWMQASCIFTGTSGCVRPTRSSIGFGIFGQGVLSAGGNIVIEAGRDVRDLSVSSPTTWYTVTRDGSSEVVTVGGGDVAVDAGRDILSGAFFVSRGEGLIRAGRDVRADLSNAVGLPLATLIALQDARLRLTAGGSVDIGGVFNPSYLFVAFDSQPYSTDSAFEVSARSGDIVLRRTVSEFSFGSRSALVPAYSFVLPSTLVLNALGGGIDISANGELYPAPLGQLELIADGDIRFANGTANGTYFGLIDAPEAILPSQANPIFGSGIASSFIYAGVDSPLRLHDPAGLHANDAEPVRIYSRSGSITDGSGGRVGAMQLDFSKPALLNAGLDIVDLSLRGQHLYASDVTRIRAGRDFYNTPLAPERSVAFVELGGPGTLVVEAGRNLGPITSANEALDNGYLRPNNATYPGIRTVGNQNNAFLDREGAAILLAFGTAPGVALEAFADTYIDPSVLHDPANPEDALGTPDYSKRLVEFVETVERDRLRREGVADTGVDLTPAEAWERFRQLPEYQRQLLVYGVFFDILNRTGLDYNNIDSRFAQQYGRGFGAVGSLFPAAYGYTSYDTTLRPGEPQKTVSTGRLDMRGSTVQTQRGGDILVVGPGGSVVVGSASAPPVVPASRVTAGIGPNNQGILTLEQGAIRVFTDQNVLLAQSRIFTEQGGDVIIWSSNGDINAGKGAKTSSEIPPPSFVCDFDHFCIVDAKSQVSGAGIAVLQTRAGAPSGIANLIAPRGTVDAGDAGIRVSGSLNVAAFKVANADNISVSGGSVGVPTGLVDTGALGAAGSVAASVSQTATQMGNSRQQEKSPLVITVEVLGFGG
jgi:filamentous hemagglutinin family protein